MKIYLHYLIFPSDTSDFSKKMLDDYEVTDGLNLIKSKMYNENTGNWYYLYGFTDDKKISDIFENMHDEKLFKKIIKKMSKDDYEIFKEENNMSELIVMDINKEKSYSKYPDYEGEFLVCSKNEEYDMNEGVCSQIMTMIMERCSHDYYAFKTKYIKALDYLLYCTYNRVNYYDPEFYSHQFSYGCTAEGYPKSQVYMKLNIIALYLKTFALLLRKE